MVSGGLSMAIRLRSDTDAAAMVATLNQIEGVQGVELRHS